MHVKSFKPLNQPVKIGCSRAQDSTGSHISHIFAAQFLLVWLVFVIPNLVLYLLLLETMNKEAPSARPCSQFLLLQMLNLSFVWLQEVCCKKCTLPFLLSFGTSCLIFSFILQVVSFWYLFHLNVLILLEIMFFILFVAVRWILRKEIFDSSVIEDPTYLKYVFVSGLYVNLGRLYWINFLITNYGICFYLIFLWHLPCAMFFLATLLMCAHLFPTMIL